MATLTESNSWEAGIYQLELTDPVVGGADGLSNLQAKQLANRTVWLKQQLQSTQDGLDSHAAASDPHPQYLTAPEGDAKIAAAVAALVNSSPATLDTLAEFAAALGNDPNFATTLTNLLALKAPLASPAFTDNPTAPTKAQFDNSGALTTTAFAKRMGVEFSNFNSLNASTVLTNGSIGGVVSAASATPINVTLPPTAGVPHGAAILLVSAGLGASTLLASGADLITNQSGASVSVVLGLGDTALFVKVTGEWRLEGGSVALKYSALMSGANWITPAQFDASKRLATAEFVKQAGLLFGGQTVFSASGSITAAMAGRVVFINAAGVTLTLPAPASVPAGEGFYIVANAAGANISCSSGVFTNYGAVTNVGLADGDSFWVASDGTNWNVVNRGGKSYVGLGGNGYQRVPGGTIFQRGSGSISGGSASVTFAATFPTACRQVVIVENSASGWSASNLTVYGIHGKSQTGFTARAANWGGSAFAMGAGNFDYIAIGE